MRTAKMTKEWGEVGIGSKKRDGWAWEVELYEDNKLYDRRIFEYYTATGCQAALDYAFEWDKGFIMGDLRNAKR